MEADRTVAIYSLPRLLGAAARDLRRRRRVLAQRAARPPVRRRPAAHRRRRRRAELAVGARAALHDRQHALRGRQGAAAHDQPRPGGAARADRRAHRVAARTRCAATRCRMCGADQRGSEHAESSPSPTSDAICGGRRAVSVRPRPSYTHGAWPASSIVGAQWGDEGKGKITDLLAENADLVIRFQGGNNAGHTIVRDGREVEIPPDPVGDPLPRQAVRDRQRRRDRPEGADRRARGPAAPRASTCPACGSAPTRT